MKSIIKKIILISAFCLIMMFRPDMFWRGVMVFVVYRAIDLIYRIIKRSARPKLSKILPNNWFNSYDVKNR